VPVAKSDALVLKVGAGGRVINVRAQLATGVNADGHREILGLQVTSAEDGAGWLDELVSRGLLSATEAEQLISAVHAHLADPNTLVIRHLHRQARGRKPSG
jgi:transposase-like protein